MKTLKPTKTWILICSIILISSATEHATSHHDVTHPGDSTPWKKHQNTIAPFGIQMPDHVLSTPDLSFISADYNIFEIKNKAQETCNGTDMRCTFYHFVNHGYENIGTLDINKERFDDLLMKFDNWLLTAAKMDKNGGGKTKEDSSLEMASIDVNDEFGNENSSISIDMKGVNASQDGHADKLNLNINESDDDRVHSHHLKIPHEIHHKIHHGKHHNSVTAPNIHGKQRNENHIKLNAEYNPDHKYFEVYLPKDKVTGKPRTIYVEVDQDKNEFVFLDEEIDKKLNGNKPFRIELDELSEIADTAFNKIAKTSNFKDHVHNHLSDDERAIISDISKYSAVNVDAVHLDNIDVGEQMQNTINPSVYHHNTYNIEAEEQHKPDTIINVNENHIVPNKYINEAQFNIESHVDNASDVMQNDNFELQVSDNTVTDIHTDFYEMEEPLDTIEYNVNTFNLNGTENSSHDYSDIPYENDNDTSTDYFELSTEHGNVTLDDDSFVQLEDHKDTCHEIDDDDTHDVSSSNALNPNELTLQVEKPVLGNELKSTRFNNAEPNLTSAGISDYTDSQLHEISFENRLEGHTDLQSLSPEPSIPLEPYTSVTILGKDSAKILKTDSRFKSSTPYATLDLHADDSQNTASNSVVELPSITSSIFPLNSVFTPSAAPKASQYSSPIFPSPPVECNVRLNKDSKYSPLNVGVSWLPSYERIEEPLSLDHVSSPQDYVLPLPSMEYSGSSQSSPDFTPVKDTTLTQDVPSSSYVIQEPSLITAPCEFESTTPMSSKHVLLSKLGLPKPNTDYESFPTTNPSSVNPCNLKDAVNSSPCTIPQILPCSQKTLLSPIDSGLIKKSPCDNFSRESLTPCSANSYRYPYSTIPYFSNPHLKSPQYIPSYLEPLLQTPLQTASKISTLDSGLSLDQSNPCLTAVSPQEKKTIPFLPFAPNCQYSPLSPILVGQGFPSYALPCPNFWKNFPYLPYTDQNIRNNSPFLSNYFTPAYDQNHKPLPSKTIPSSIVEKPNNILEIAPSSYAPYLPVHTSQVQKKLNPALTLERDLENLKYGIPLSKILQSLETEISDSKTCPPTLEGPNFILKYDGNVTPQQSQTLSKNKANDKNRNGNDELLSEADLLNITPLDSTLIGPHLELENSLDAHNTQSYTVLSDTTEPVTTPHLSATAQQAKVIKDSSLIGPQLSTLSSINNLLSDDNRNVDELVLSESDSSNLIPFHSSLIGPHLNIGSPPVLLDSHISYDDILTSQTEVLTTSSSQIESNQNHLTNLLLDSSLTGSNLTSVSPFKPLLSNEIQIMNENIPLESDLTDLTPLDLTNKLVQSSIPAKPLLTNDRATINEKMLLESDLTDLTPLDISEADFVNQLDQSKILHHENSAVTLSAGIGSPELHKITTTANSIERELSGPIQLDSSLIGSELKLGSSLIVTDTVEEKSINLIQDKLENTKIKFDKSESIILPSSLLPTLLNEPAKADSNLDIIVQDTKLNEEFIAVSVDANVSPLKETGFKIVKPANPDLNLNTNTQNSQLNEKLSLDNYVEIPLSDTSQISVKETDFKIIEQTPDLHDSSIIPLLSNDSTTFNLKPEMSTGDYEQLLESSLMPEISSTLNSSIQLENSLVGPSIINEIDSQSPIIETVDELESSIVSTYIDQNVKPLESTAIDSKTQLDSSLIGPTFHQEMKPHEASTDYDSVTQFESSSIVPTLYEAGTKTLVSNAKSNLDTSLIMPTMNGAIEASASSSASSQLVSSLLGTSLKPELETLEESCAFDSKKLDGTLLGPHLSNKPFSSDEIKIINKELPPKSDLANAIPIDSTLIGPHGDFESQFDQSDIAPGILEMTAFLNSNFIERHPPKPNTASSIYQSDLQELLSKFKNPITKSQVSPSEFQPCDKLLSSKQSTDNINMSPTNTHLQALTWNTPLSVQEDIASDFSPITYPENELGPVVKAPCFYSNYYSSPQTFAELLPYAHGVPQIPIRPYSPSVPIKQMIDHNWIPQPLNILQASPDFRPVVGNSPVPFISNSIMPLAPEDLKLLLDLASQSKTFPQLSMPNISTPIKAIPPSLEWSKLSNILPLEKYVPSLPIKNFPIIPSNSESSICNSEYTPIEVDNSYQLLKDMAILPFSQPSLTPTGPVFDKGEVLNSDLIKKRPILPITITNSMVPSSMCTNPQIGLYNPQNIPKTIPTSNILPGNLQPYYKTPLDALFSEIVGPVPKIESLPVESSKSSLESHWQEIPNTPEFMESIPNSSFDREFVQQLLSKPCLESPKIQPSSLLHLMLQSSTASNKSESFPCQSPPLFFTPISPVLTTQLSNAFTRPVSPIYASPLSVSYAKPILAPSSRLPLNLPYAASPLTPLTIGAYTASSVIPDFSSPLRPLKSTALSNYLIAPTEIYNRPIPSRIPYKPSHVCSNPFSPVYASTLPFENSPYSSTFMSKLAPAETSLNSPVLYEPVTAPYFSPEPKSKSLTGFETPTYSSSISPGFPIPMASSPTSVFQPSYIIPDLSSYTYSPRSLPINTPAQPSSTLSPPYITPISPVSSILPSYTRPLPSKPMFNLKPEITSKELEKLRLLNTLPITNTNSVFLDANQKLLTSSNILPLQNYHEHVPKPSPYSSSQIKQIKPNEDIIGSNLQTTSLTEETPYGIDENMYTYNDKDNKYFEEHNFKYPLESLSYTLATEQNPKEDFIKQKDLTSSAPVTNLAFEPSLQSKLYPKTLLTPYTPLYGEQILRPCPTPQSLLHPSLVKTLPQSIFDNIPLEPSLQPLNHPLSLPASILSSPLLNPLTALTSADNLPLLPSPCIHTLHKHPHLNPYKVLPTDEKPLFSSPYYSATSEDMLAPPTDPKGLGMIIPPQLTPAFSQVSAPYVPISSTTNSPASPYNLDNYIELPLSYNELKSKKQNAVKLFTVPSYSQFASPMISHSSPLDTKISSQYISPITSAESLKKPLISSQYLSSISPSQTLQESSPLNEAPHNYQPYRRSLRI